MHQQTLDDWTTLWSPLGTRQTQTRTPFVENDSMMKMVKMEVDDSSPLSPPPVPPQALSDTTATTTKLMTSPPPFFNHVPSLLGATPPESFFANLSPFRPQPSSLLFDGTRHSIDDVPFSSPIREPTPKKVKTTIWNDASHVPKKAATPAPSIFHKLPGQSKTKALTLPSSSFTSSSSFASSSLATIITSSAVSTIIKSSKTKKQGTIPFSKTATNAAGATGKSTKKTGGTGSSTKTKRPASFKKKATTSVSQVLKPLKKVKTMVGQSKDAVDKKIPPASSTSKTSSPSRVPIDPENLALLIEKELVASIMDFEKEPEPKELSRINDIMNTKHHCSVDRVLGKFYQKRYQIRKANANLSAQTDI